MPTAGTSAGAAAPRKVLVVGEDQRTADAVRMAFERDGFPVVATTELGPELVDDSVGLIVASAADAGAGKAALEQAVKARGDGGRDVPVLYVGNGVTRRDAVSAGADEVIGRPAFARDVVTIGRMLVGQPLDSRGHWVGQLAETVGVYYLVRALASLGRSGVLTLSRGLRRGEVRFYLGEVTSAQVGGLHGQAALHQLLLWTDGRFDFRREDLVRRRQIPLLPEELFADAERFLESVREVSGGLSPAMVFEQDPRQMQNQGRNVPTEVHGVLRMFDGNRTLADVIEDSPYRVFETMRVASMAVQAGLLRRVAVERPKTKFRVVLALEEWLAGESRAAVADRVASLADSGSNHPITPIVEVDSTRTPAPAGKGRRKKRPPSAVKAAAEAKTATMTPARPLAPASIDWGALVPRGVAVEIQGLSQVVPTQQASGEIMIPRDLDEAPATRKSTRERLESITTEARDRMFPRDAPIATVEVLPSVMAGMIGDDTPPAGTATAHAPVPQQPAPVPQQPAPPEMPPPPLGVTPAMEGPPMSASIAEATSGPAIDAVPRVIQSSGMTPVSFAIPMPSSTGVPPEVERARVEVEPPEIIPLPPPGDTLQIAVVPMPTAGETLRGVFVPSSAPQEVITPEFPLGESAERLPPAPRAEPAPVEIGARRTLGEPLPAEPAMLGTPAATPPEDPTTPMQRVDAASLILQQADGTDEDAEWTRKSSEARARADATERAEAAEWERRERIAKERAAVEEAAARVRAAAEEDVAAASRAHADAEAAAARAQADAEAAAAAADKARAEAEKARAEAAERARAAAAHLELAERMRIEMAERLRAEAERAEAEDAARLEADRRLEAERARLEAEREAHERVEVEKALSRAREIADRMRAEAAAAAKTLADVERVRAEAEKLAADTDAADRDRVAAAAAEASTGAAAQQAMQAAEAERERQAAAAAAARQAAAAAAERERQAAAAAAEHQAAAAAAERHAAAERERQAALEAEDRRQATIAEAERARQAALARAEAEAAIRVQAEADARARATAAATDAEPEDVTAPRVRIDPSQVAAPEPSILATDLAAAHAAVSTVVAQQAAQTTTDARTAQAETMVSGVRRDAKTQAAHAGAHFDEIEEQFFQQGASPTYGQPSEPVENFDDLDKAIGYQPSSFWDRMLGRDKKRKPPPKR